MTKDQYFEMCAMLGSEPNEEEIPVEFEDLNDDIQLSISVYNMLQDNWDTMNGIYLGKSITGISDVFKMMSVEDHRTCFNIISILDRIRRDIINKKTPTK